MPKPVLCPICSHKIPYGTIHADLLSHHPRFGKPHPGQSTIACPSCGRYLHVASRVREFKYSPNDWLCRHNTA